MRKTAGNPWFRNGLLLAIASLGFACASTSRNERPNLSGTEKARLYLDVANAALMENDAISALESLIQAEREDSKLADVHHAKALAYTMKKEPELAMASARRAHELDPKSSSIHTTLGGLLLEQGHAREAEGHLTAAARDPLNREAFKAFLNLGILHYRSGEDAKARKDFEKAIELNASLACVGYYYIGHLDLKAGRFQKAADAYHQSTDKLCAGFTDGHLALGIAYERMKRFDLARRKFLEIQQKYPNSKVAEQAMQRLRFLP